MAAITNSSSVDDIKTFLLCFSEANRLEENETKTLLHCFKRTNGAAFLFLTDERIKERLWSAGLEDLEIIDLLCYARFGTTTLSIDARAPPAPQSSPPQLQPTSSSPPTPTRPIAAKFGETLIGKSGNVATSTALADAEVVGIYFSYKNCVWWDPRKPENYLNAKYTQLKNAGKNFELIFVSSDQEEEAFNEYYGSMSFLALPYSERQRKDDLRQEFRYFFREMQEPFLVLLDAKTGNLISALDPGLFYSIDSFHRIQPWEKSGYQVADFPWHKPLIPQNASLLEQLGHSLVGQDGNVPTASALEGKDAIGLFFSKGLFCGNDQEKFELNEFMKSTLGEKYNALKAAGKGFELVFISPPSETWDEKSFNEYHATMPFLALPFSQNRRAFELGYFYELDDFPMLVILDAKTGQVITKNGEFDYSGESFIEDYPFHPKPVYDSSDPPFGFYWNSLREGFKDVAFVVFMEQADKQTQDAISMQVIAIATAELKKPDADLTVLRFFTACKGGDTGGDTFLRHRFNLGDATTNPQILILDPRRERHCVISEAVTAENIETFLTAFKAGSLQCISWN